MGVIFLNAIWISIDIEFNDAAIISEADWGFILVENLFCTYFTGELLIRFATYKRTCNAFKDAWFLGSQAQLHPTPMQSLSEEP